jgi:hypothetical protein
MLWLPISLLVLCLVFATAAIVSYNIERRYHEKHGLTEYQREQLRRLEHWDE